jgi:hypothetical protein
MDDDEIDRRNFSASLTRWLASQPEPPAGWRKARCPATMTRRQYDQWCRDGKPQTPTVSKAADSAHAVPEVDWSQWDAWVRAHVDEGLAVAMETAGAELGATERELLSRIDALQARLVALEEAYQALKTDRSGGVRRGGDAA